MNNNYYDGRTVFFIDAKKLKPGDVILTRNRRDENIKGRIKSSGIAAAGRSNFSHVLIVSEPPTMIEAIGPGVSLLSVSRTFYHTEEDVRVLRYHNEEVSRQASQKAGLFLGKGYSVKMAVRSVLPNSAGADEPMIKTFCSALVSAAYRKSGAVEFLDINPYRTTPGDFVRMNFFKDVTMDVSTKKLAPDNIEMMSALDGDRQPSPFDGQAKELFALYAVVADDIDALYKQYNFNLELPTSFFEVLEFLVKALSVANSSDDQKLRNAHSNLMEIDRNLASSFDNSNIHKILEDAVKKDSVTLMEQVRKSFEASPGIDVEFMRSMIKTTDGQIRSRSWVLENKSRAPGLSLAWDRWRTFSAKGIQELKNRRAILCEIIERIDPSKKT